MGLVERAREAAYRKVHDVFELHEPVVVDREERGERWVTTLVCRCGARWEVRREPGNTVSARLK